MTDASLVARPPALTSPTPLPDPRRETRNKLHDILMIALCAVLIGLQDWVGIKTFAEQKENWLRGFLNLPK